MKVLITGCTGVIGSGILSRIVDNPKYDQIYVMLRPGKYETAKQRFAAIKTTIFPPYKQALVTEKIKVIEGDLSHPKLGIIPIRRRELIHDLNQIIHAGALASSSVNMSELRKANLYGTQNLLKLAEAAKKSGQFRRFDFVSTAFVVGNKQGTVSESDLDRGQDFSSNYERSKFEAEKMIHTYMGKFPITITRPSIVVGHSDNGYTPKFKGLYEPVKLASRSKLPFLPVNKNALLDIVPSDFVCNAIVALMQSDEAHNRTFLLTAGKGNEVTVSQLIDDAVRVGVFPRKVKLPVWVYRTLEYSPLGVLFARRFKELRKMAKPYKDYILGAAPRFDCSETQKLLRKLGVHQPVWGNYHQNIFAFAGKQVWGQKPSEAAHIYLRGEEPPVSLEAVRFQKRADAKVALGGAPT